MPARCAGTGEAPGAGGAKPKAAVGLALLAGLALGLLGADALSSPRAAAPPSVERSLLPSIAPLTAEGPALFVTRLSNVVQPNGEPLSFDHLVSGEGWEPGSALVVPSSGWWQVGVNLTTLGERYGGPTNADVAISVVRNWDRSAPFLTSTVAIERFRNRPEGWDAEVNSLLQPVWLEAGDRLEVVTVGGPDGLLVESNPSDGLPDGFAADEGAGTLSPHFFLLPG